MGAGPERPPRDPSVGAVRLPSTGHTGAVPDLTDDPPAVPDPNDSRTWPRWMTRSVLLTGILGVLVTIALTVR